MREFDAHVSLIGGAGGVFDVTANGKLVFSKHVTRRFPEESEIVEALRPLA